MSRLRLALIITLALPFHGVAQSQLQTLWIASSYGGKCLDFGPTHALGSPIVIADCDRTDEQQIGIEEIDSNHHVILHAGGNVIGINNPGSSMLLNPGQASRIDLATPVALQKYQLELQSQANHLENSFHNQVFALDGDSIVLVANPELVVQVDVNKGVNNTALIVDRRELKDAEFWTLTPADRRSRLQPTSGFVRVPEDLKGSEQIESRFANAVTNAGPGTVFLLDSDFDLTVTDVPIKIPAGVTIRGDRRGTNVGPRLTTGAIGLGPDPDDKPPCDDVDPNDHRTQTPRMLEIAGDGIRITGLRLQGPSLTTGLLQGWIGILAKDQFSTIIDHDELSGWTIAAVNDLNCANVFVDNPPTARPTPVQIVRNFIHNNEMQGLGYGVDSAEGAFPLIQGNTYISNRHAIAADGKDYTGYLAWSNLVQSTAPEYSEFLHTDVEQDFDMHGRGPGHSLIPGNPCFGVEYCGGSAGEYIYIKNNTFLGTNRLNFFLRGTPSYLAVFRDNYVRRPENTAISNAGDASKLVESNNSFGSSYCVPYISLCIDDYLSDPTSRLAVGDFDGDGRDDLFLATGAAWYYAPAGTAEWHFLSANKQTLDHLLLGDFDGDGRTDVFWQNGNEWFISWGGTSLWYKVNEANTNFADLAVGDFDGDGRSDIFYSDGTQWFVSSGAVGPLVHVQTSHLTVPNLRFGDFDGDGKTDVFGVVTGAWQVSLGATSSWTYLQPKLTDDVSGLVVADLDGDGKADVVNLHNRKVSYKGIWGWQSLTSFDSSAFAGVGRFQTHSHADLLFWSGNYLDIIPGGIGNIEQQSRSEMR